MSDRTFSSRLIIVAAASLLGVMSGCSGGGGGDAAPVAHPDTYTSDAGQLTISRSKPGVLGNDSGSGITAAPVSGPSHGQLTLNPDGSFTYVHNGTSTATTDSFTYVARNGTGDSSPATVTLNITPPVATNDTFSVNRNFSVSGNVLTNTPADTPASGVTVELVPGSGPAHHQGSFSVNASTGAFTYTHNGDSAIVDSFRYRTKVGAIYSNEATVTININQPPVASNACPTITDGTTSLEVNLATSVSDPNGVGTFTFTITAPPANGSVSSTTSTDGLFTYQPSANTTGRRGMDRFTFTVTDADGLTSPPATVWVLNNGKVRIMPLGDSITDGIETDNPDDSPPVATRVAYRKKLFEDLISAGYSVDFVGSQSSGSSILSDPHHEGHPGWCTFSNAQDGTCNTGSGIAENIRAGSAWFNNDPPDVVLLHIGTNDLGQGRSAATTKDGVMKILDEIDAWEAQNFPVTVFVAKIIDDADPNVGGNLDVSTFNSALQAALNSRSDQVVLVDIHSGIDPDSGQPLDYRIGYDMASDLHPNASGYNKMAGIWRAALTNSANVGPKYLGLPQCP